LPDTFSQGDTSASWAKRPKLDEPFADCWGTGSFRKQWCEPATTHSLLLLLIVYDGHEVWVHHTNPTCCSALRSDSSSESRFGRNSST